PGWRQQMASASGSVSPRSEKSRRASEDGVWRSAWRMVAWLVAKLGGKSAIRETVGRERFLRRRRDPPTLDGASLRAAKLAIPALGRPYVRSLARALG